LKFIREESVRHTYIYDEVTKIENSILEYKSRSKSTTDPNNRTSMNNLVEHFLVFL